MPPAPRKIRAIIHGCLALLCLGLAAPPPASAGPARLMPDMRGWPRARAVAWMNQAGLQFKRVHQVKTDDPSLDERVIATEPKAGARVRKGQPVSFSYYIHPEEAVLDGRVKTPALIGLDRNQALLKVLAAGLKPRALAGPPRGDSEEVASSRELVYEQHPLPGRLAPAGSLVRFTFLPLPKGPAAPKAAKPTPIGKKNCRTRTVRLDKPHCVTVCRLRPVCKAVTKCFSAPACERRLVCKPRGPCTQKRLCQRKKVCDEEGKCRWVRSCRLVPKCRGGSSCKHQNICRDRQLCKKVKSCTNFKTCRPFCRTELKKEVCTP